MVFEETLVPYKWNSDWIEGQVLEMISLLNSQKIPKSNSSCENCAYAHQRTINETKVVDDESEDDDLAIGKQYFYDLKKDKEKAFKHFLHAAEQGNVEAQFYLGLMFDQGKGVKENSKESIKWYRLAAEGGHHHSQLILSINYALGYEGLPEDPVLANMWYYISISCEKKPPYEEHMQRSKYFKSSKKSVPDGIVNLIEVCGTPQQKEEAQEMARNWKPKTKT